MPATPRERLRTALAHREPDRVPFDLGSTQVTSIAAPAQRRLRERLGLPEGPTRVCDRVQQLDHVEEDLLRVLGVDTRGLWPLTARNAPVEERDDGTHLSHVDEWGLTYRIPREGALWYDLAASPLAGGALTRERIDAHPWPRGDDPRLFAHLRAEATAHREAGYAVVLKSLCAGLFEMAQRLRGMEAFLMDLVDEPGRGRSPPRPDPRGEARLLARRPRRPRRRGRRGRRGRRLRHAAVAARLAGDLPLRSSSPAWPSSSGR